MFWIGVIAAVFGVVVLVGATIWSVRHFLREQGSLRGVLQAQAVGVGFALLGAGSIAYAAPDAVGPIRIVIAAVLGLLGLAVLGLSWRITTAETR
jgi:hypothetical protein